MKELLQMMISARWKELFLSPSTNLYVQLFRYVFVGGFAFVADAGVLFLLTKCGMHYLFSAAIAFFVGLLVNFILSKKAVFSAQEAKTNQRIEFLAYGGIGLIGLALTEIILYLLTEKIKIFYLLSKCIAAAIVLIWNFVARKVLLYR